MHKDSPTKSVTRLLGDWRQGRADALDELMPIVYDELRRLARRYLHHERPGTRCRRRRWCMRHICDWLTNQESLGRTELIFMHWQRR